MTVQLGPYRPVTEFVTHDLARLRKRTKQLAFVHAGRSDPGFDGLLDPDGDRYRPDAATLAAEIDDHPSSFTELDVLGVEGC